MSKKKTAASIRADKDAAEFRAIITGLRDKGDLDGIQLVREMLTVLVSVDHQDGEVFSSALLSHVDWACPSLMDRAMPAARGVTS
jgi:hypothetical protein